MSDTLDAHTPGVALSKAEFEEYQLRTEAMLNSLGEGLIVTDVHGDITTVNKYAVEALGYAEAELLGNWLPKTIVVVDQYSQPVDQLSRPIIKCLTTGKTVSARTHYLTKNGDVLPVHITVSPIIINDLPTGAIEVFRDLTSEQQLDIAKEDFVSLASHQLRTPATAVKSILSMLLNGDFGPLTETQAEYLAKTASSNNRQLQVIEDLLSVAQVDAGKMELDLQYLDLAGLLRETISDHLSSLSSRNQTLNLQTPRQARLLVDPQKLRMAVDNLISNASKYSPEGTSIWVDLDIDSESATLTIRDEGVGIPPADLPKLFTKFQRLPNELSPAAGGTGLGLFLTKSIINLHHGTLSVASRVGEGTTFTIRLPVKWSQHLT